MRISRFASLVLTLALLSSSLPRTYASHPAPFPDMENTWFRYKEAVEELKSRNIIGGYPDGTFRPNDPINRAELLKIIFKGHNVTKPTRRCFSDVNPDAWYAPYVCAAERRGIIDGYPDGTYRPGRTVNFAEAIKIIANTYGFDVPQGGQNWFDPFVNHLDSNDIFPAHSYVPWDELTRIRAADLIWRVLKYDEDGTIFRYSSGCNKAATGVSGNIYVNGQNRSYLITVPNNYVIHDPVPLVIAFHGRTSPNHEVKSYYRLDRHMDDAIIIYPAGVSNGNGSFSWSNPGDPAQNLRDIALFDALVEEISSKYCIDMDQIYVVGHSLGGWFANSVACVRGDVVRGSASVGSSTTITDCGGPSAAMIIHNPNDRLAAFSGSEKHREYKVEINACNWDLQSVSPQSFNCISHGACATNSVHFCPHEIDTDWRGNYYPHNWPNDTGRYVASFFCGLK